MDKKSDYDVGLEWCIKNDKWPWLHENKWNWVSFENKAWPNSCVIPQVIMLWSMLYSTKDEAIRDLGRRIKNVRKIVN